MTEFYIPGPPVPKARPRFGNGHTYTPKKTKSYEMLVGLSYRGPLFTGAVAVSLVFVTNGQGDIDNLIKSVLDGLNGRAWLDDSQVVKIEAEKFPGDEPGVTVNICEYSQIREER